MLIYVSHEWRGKDENFQKAKKIVHDLQVKDLDNCYICPLLAFQYLNYCELAYSSEMDLRFDLISACDKILVVCDNIDEDVNAEIEFAELIGMEVDYLD